MQTETSEGGLMTSREAAQWLRVSEAMVRKLARQGEIPKIKLGAATRYDRRDLQAYVDACKSAAR